MFVVPLLFIALPVFADTTPVLLPEADGFYRQWIPRYGKIQYQQVTETYSCDGTRTYDSTTTLNSRDSFRIGATYYVPNGSQITKIDITPCASKSSSGKANSEMKVFYRVDGVDSEDSTSYELRGTMPSDLPTYSFSGLNIPKGSTTNLEIGVVYSGGTKGVRLSRISAVVTYTPPVVASSGLTATASKSSSFWSFFDFLR